MNEIAIARNERIKSQPLVRVGGVVSEGWAISILAHDGYHHGALARTAEISIKEVPEVGPYYLAAGSDEDPAWSWPVYAVRTR